MPLDEGSGAAVLRKLVEVGQLFNECADRHDAVVEAVKVAPGGGLRRFRHDQGLAPRRLASPPRHG
jgi:hypothetical protein